MRLRPRFLLSFGLAGLLAAVSTGQDAGQDAASPPADAARNERLARLARTAAAGVRWIADPYRRLDRDRRNSTPQPYVPAVDRKVLLDAALARAKATGRLVLVYAFRIQGGHIYRGSVLDDYMNLALFADPELAALINRKFVPLRLHVDRRIGKELGVINRGPSDPLSSGYRDPGSPPRHERAFLSFLSAPSYPLSLFRLAGAAKPPPSDSRMSAGASHHVHGTVLSTPRPY